MKMIERPRRLRRSESMRRLVREQRIDLDALVQPLFVDATLSGRRPVLSMPGIDRLGLDVVADEAVKLWESGIRSLLLFGIPEHKDAYASANADPEGIVQRATRLIKARLPEMVIFADLCNCEYTDHGHCGILDAVGNVLNDPTVELLVATALSYARCGVDVVAPSDMMDGRVGAIRRALDEAGYPDIAIASYAVKYASAFYGPFRDAADSAPAFGDRRGYQMDPANGVEALREARLDIAEGADLLIVKPGMTYYDIVYRLAERVDVPIAVYSVSGEYAMIKAAAAQGWIDEARIVDEMLIGAQRAGARVIVTYFAGAVARRLRGEG